MLRQSPRKTSAAYLFHDVCWLMLSCRIADKPSDVTPTMIARVLYYTLQCTSTGKTGVVSPPQVWGASSFRMASTAVEYEQSLPRELGFLLADPTETPKQRLEPYLSEVSAVSAASCARFGQELLPKDRLSRLPPELVGQNSRSSSSQRTYATFGWRPGILPVPHSPIACRRISGKADSPRTWKWDLSLRSKPPMPLVQLQTGAACTVSSKRL